MQITQELQKIFIEIVEFYQILKKDESTLIKIQTDSEINRKKVELIQKYREEREHDQIIRFLLKTVGPLIVFGIIALLAHC